MKALQREGILSPMVEPGEESGVSGDLPVTDGFKTKGPQTKERLLATGSHRERKTAVSVQRDPTKPKEISVQTNDLTTASVEIKDIKKDTKVHKEAFLCLDMSVKAGSDEKQVVEAEQEGVISQGREEGTDSSVTGSVLPKVVPLKDKRVKVGPMKRTTEMKSTDSVSSALEVRHPESVSGVKTLQSTEVFSKEKDIVDEDRVKAVVKDNSVQEKTKPRQSKADSQSCFKSEQEGAPKQTCVPELDPTKARDSGRKERAVKGKEDLHVKEREQMLRETKDQPARITEDKQLLVTAAENIKTGPEQSERKASTVNDMKQLEPEPTLASTKETKEVQLKRVTGKSQTSRTEKEMETAQMEEVPLKSESNIDDVQSEVRGDKTNTCIPTEEPKIKKRHFRKPSIEEKEKPQKQRRQKPSESKTDDVQSKIRDETDEDTLKTRINEAEQERVEGASSVSPGIRMTPKESRMADSQKQADRKSSVHLLKDATPSEPDVIVQTGRAAEIPAKHKNPEDVPLKDEVAKKETRPSVNQTGKSKVKEVQLKTDEQRDELSPNVQLNVVKAEDRLPKASKTEEQEQRERPPQEPQHRPQKVLVELEQLTVGRIKDTTFRVTPLNESKQGLIDRKVSVQPLTLELTPEEHAGIREMAAVDEELDSFDEKASETSITLKKRQPKSAQIKEAADKQIPSKSLKVEHKTEKVTPVEDGAPTIAEQRIKRKVLDASEVEVQGPHTKHLVEQDTQKTGKEGIPESEVRRSKEETQKMKRLPKLPKTGDKIDKSQSVRKEQTSLNEDEKTKQENLLRADAAKQTGHEERAKGEAPVSLKKDEAQRDKRPKSTECKEITVEEVTVTDEYGRVTPLEATSIQWEQVEVMTAKKHPTVKDEDVQIDIPQRMISSDDGFKDVSLRKEKELEGENGSNLIPVQRKTEKVSPVEKKKLKKREGIAITASYAAEPELTSEESDAPEQSGKSAKTVQPTRDSKKDKTDQCTALEEMKTMQKERERQEEVIPEIRVREKNLDDTSQDKDQALVKTQMILDETGKVSSTVETKPRRHKQMQKTDPVSALRDKPSEEATAEETRSKTVVVQHEYSGTTPLEGEETKQQHGQMKSRKDGDALLDSSKHITVKQVQEKREGKISVSDVSQPEVTHEHTVTDKHPITDQTTTVLSAEEAKTRPKQTKTSTAATSGMEETKAGTVTGKDEVKRKDEFKHISQKKEEPRTEKALKFDKTSIEDIQNKKYHEEKSQRLGRSTKTSLKEVQSKTVVVRDDYGSVTPFEATETKPEQVGTASVARVMEVASERSLMVADGDVRTETLRRYTTPDGQIQVIEQVMPKLDLAQDQTGTVSAIRGQGKASDASQREVTSLMQQEAPGRLSELEKTTTVLQAEEKQTKEKTTETKTTGTSVTDAEIKDLESNKSKPLKEKAKRLDRVQSKVVTVRDEYGSVAPINVLETKQEQVENSVPVAPVMEVTSEKHLQGKEGDVESESLQRFVLPDRLVKDFHESTEVLLGRHSQSPETPKQRVEALAGKQELANKEISPQFNTEDLKSVKQKQTQQKSEVTAVTHQKIETILRKDKEFQDKEKGTIKATRQELISGDQLAANERDEKMYQEVVDQVEVSDKNQPLTTESKAIIELMPTITEPSVTDQIQPKRAEQQTLEALQYQEAATRKQEVERSRLKADVSVSPLEAEPIGRRKGDAQGLRPGKESRVLSLGPEGREQCSRGIEDSGCCVTSTCL